MKNRLSIVYVLLAGIALGLLIVFLVGRPESGVIQKAAGITPETLFDQPPVFVGVKNLAENDTTLRPFAITRHQRSIFISYLSKDRIDEFSEDLEYLRSLHVLNGEPASITGLAVEDGRLYAADFHSGELLFVDLARGELTQAYGWLPGHEVKMKLLGVSLHDGNVYATDAASNQIVVISTSTVPGVREEGELILHFPGPRAEEYRLGFATWTYVTPDGRLLISDAGTKDIKAFTCNGRPAHVFEKTGPAAVAAPMGIAMDNVPSPDLLATADTSFHPSGVYHQGRVHVVDALHARVKVFNALGKYVLSYGEELRQPNGIVIDSERRLILITDTLHRGIIVYKY